MASQKIRHILPMAIWSIKFVLTNYQQLLPYISYERSDLYMLVTTKAFLVAITK